jgi:hypothetical protein
MLPTSRRSGRRRRDAALLLVSAALLLSCGDGTGPDERGRGSYRATIRGSVNETAEGPAAFVAGAGEWTVILLPPELSIGWDFFIRGTGARPSTGAVLSITARDFDGLPSPGDVTADVARSQGDDFDMWVASSGQIRIIESSEQWIKGTFELSAQPLFGSGLGPITVTGTFDARFLGERPPLIFP